MSKNAPLQNGLNKRDRPRRAGVEFEWPQFAFRLIVSEEPRDEIDLDGKLMGVVTDEGFSRTDGGRREGFAALHLAAFTFIFL